MPPSSQAGRMNSVGRFVFLVEWLIPGMFHARGKDDFASHIVDDWRRHAPRVLRSVRHAGREDPAAGQLPDADALTMMFTGHRSVVLGVAGAVAAQQLVVQPGTGPRLTAVSVGSVVHRPAYFVRDAASEAAGSSWVTAPATRAPASPSRRQPRVRNRFRRQGAKTRTLRRQSIDSTPASPARTSGFVQRCRGTRLGSFTANPSLLSGPAALVRPHRPVTPRLTRRSVLCHGWKTAPPPALGRGASDASALRGTALRRSAAVRLPADRSR